MLLLLICIIVFNKPLLLQSLPTDNDVVWSGRWFPKNPGSDPDQDTLRNPNLHDSHRQIPMGVRNPKCDDGETNLQTDWFNDPRNYTCFSNALKDMYKPNVSVHPIHFEDIIPEEYHAPHSCMNERIHYDDPIPTFGTHRPLWAVYGEYSFVPKQRWLHNLEHGAVVMLYHPCVDQNQANLLKNLVKKCLYRHVITPYTELPPDRPFALLTWGHRLQMSRIDKNLSISFMKKHAFKGPEQTSRDGQYVLGLKEKADLDLKLDENKPCQKL